MTIVTSLSSHSHVIDFSLTTQKEEQEQPSLFFCPDLRLLLIVFKSLSYACMYLELLMF
jgi:hypothetical protein